MKVPGLAEAMEKLDLTSNQMSDLVVGISKIVHLLEEQNELIRELTDSFNKMNDALATKPPE